MTAEQLEALSQAATQGEWEVHDYCRPSERRMIWDSPLANTMCIEAVKPNDAAFITTLVALYRQGQLIMVDDGAVERVAELQLAAFLAGRGSVTSTKNGTRTAKPAPTMDQFRQMGLAALKDKP